MYEYLCESLSTRPNRPFAELWGYGYQHSPALDQTPRHSTRLHKGQIKAAPAFVSRFLQTMPYMYVHMVRYRPCKNPT